MDLRKLEFLRAVAEHGSFKRAAEAVHVSGPALTKGIQSLEQELQITLFDRKRGHPLLTSAGRKVLLRARRMLDEASQIQADMDRERGLESGEIRIGCGPIVMHTILGRAMGILSSNHPGIRVTAVSGNWEILSRQLEDYSLDLVAADIGAARNKPQFRVQALEPEALVWTASLGHPLASKLAVELGDILDYPTALPTAPLHMINWLEQKHGAQAAGRLSSPRIRSDNYATLLSTARRSQCLTLVPKSLARNAAVLSGMMILDVVDWSMQSQPGIITLAARAPSAAVDAMKDAMSAASVDVVNENTRADPTQAN
jgi:DNA-binding transcriptional LysR family regulator